ncbi:MAG TPA: hypothetical protein VHM70_26525 [Polyangiaceae bacterium]|jgi:hypothetical protein|nr:hypothetical protein [Polyangiaceae bacterium]
MSRTSVYRLGSNRLSFKRLSFNRLGGFVALTIASSALFACTYYARGPEDFRKDTRALVEPKAPEIRACYEKLLKKDEKLKGTVAVQFLIKKKTGEFSDVKVAGDAPDSLKKCVVKVFEGLKLEPVDERDGRGEFVYEFKSDS